jgi:iron complex outermembrane recepter protein
MRVRTLAWCSLTTALWLTTATARAHDATPPVPLEQPLGAWPGQHAESHDVVVPVVLTVAPDGTVSEAVVEATLDPAFDSAALSAARRFVFRPASRDGQPIAAKVRAVVRFAGVKEHVHPVDLVPPGAVVPATGPAPPPVASPSLTSPSNVTVQGQSPPRSASESVRGKEIIRAVPRRSGSDALSVVPGLYLSQHAGEGKGHQMFLRGFDSQHGQDIEVNVAGLPVNEVSHIHGQGYVDMFFVMPEVMREVRALPGAYDPRQGDFGVAGSLRVGLGYDEPGITTKGTLGAFGTQRLFLAYHPKDASEETFAAFENYSTDGFGPNRAARRSSFLAQATHDLGDGLALRGLFTAYAGRFDTAGVVRREDIDTGRLARDGFHDPRQNGASTKTHALVELHKDDERQQFRVAPFIGLRTMTLRENYTGFLLDTLRSGANEGLRSDNNQQRQDNLMFGANASYRRVIPVLSERDAFEVGFYGRSDNMDQSQKRLDEATDLPFETNIDANVRATNLAGYLDAQVHPLSRLVVRGGVRVDALAYTVADRVLPRVADTPSQSRTAQGTHTGKKLTLDYALVPGLHALASYGEGFRSPQARALADGERTPFTSTTSYEAGVRYAHKKALAGSLAVFHTELSDDLVFNPLLSRNDRTPGTARTGVAVDLQVRAGDILVASGVTYTNAAFTGSDTVYQKGDLLPYVPQLVVRTDALWSRKVAKVAGRDLEAKAGAGFSGMGQRPLPYSEIGTNVFLVDAQAGLRVKEVELTLGAFNLLDAQFFDSQYTYSSNFGRSATPSRLPVQHVTIGPPRSVFATLSLYL